MSVLPPSLQLRLMGLNTGRQMNSRSMKQKSIDTFRIWKDAGEFGSGMMFDMYLQK